MRERRHADMRTKPESSTALRRKILKWIEVPEDMNPSLQTL
jgi:hypothetical protein